jgi:hypothetical protein
MIIFSESDMKTILNFKIKDIHRRYFLNPIMPKGFIYVGEGRHRIVFISPNKRYVLKFPKIKTGVMANKEEAKFYSEYKLNHHREEGNLAPCRLIQNTVLMMRAVIADFGFQDGYDVAAKMGIELPDWVEDYDANQVGLLANGKLAAYDYTVI